MKNHFDVIIIGGSYAGLSAAMALGRSLKRVLIIDGGQPSNRFTPHSHNFITQDGETPFEIARKAKEQVLKYSTVTFFEDFATNGIRTETGFQVETISGEGFSADKLIFATGIKDIFPDIEDFRECWGKTIIHCPYCHGYEFRGQATGIMATGERAFHLATLVHNLTDSLSLITSKADFSEDQLARLYRNNIEIIDKQVAGVTHENGALNEVRFSDGSVKKMNALYASLTFKQHSDIPVSLGCELTEMGHIKIDGFQKTSVLGVFACGDNSSMMRSVAFAVASGNIAGAMVNSEISSERF